MGKNGQCLGGLVLYVSVSKSIAIAYTDTYGLSAYEWRTVAILGPFNHLSGKEIVRASSMDKVQVSRAVESLRKRGFLKRSIDEDDKRRSVLYLTDEGRRVFLDLIPRVLQIERKLFRGLSEEEVKVLTKLMARVRSNADKIR